MSDIIARTEHQSSLRGRKEGWVMRICNLGNLIPQIEGEDTGPIPNDELYGILRFGANPKASQEDARAALKEIHPGYKEVGWDEFENCIGFELERIRRTREEKARDLGWQRNSTGRGCVKCGGPINSTTGGPSSIHGQIGHGWSKCADCKQEYCTTYYTGATRLNSNEPMPPSWSYRDEKGDYISIDPPEFLEINAKWEEILNAPEHIHNW